MTTKTAADYLPDLDEMLIELDVMDPAYQQQVASAYIDMSRAFYNNRSITYNEVIDCLIQAYEYDDDYAYDVLDLINRTERQRGGTKLTRDL